MQEPKRGRHGAAPHPTRVAVRLAFLAVATCASGYARAEAPPAEPPSIADSSLRAVLGGEISLRLQDGGERRGVMVRFSSEAITLEHADPQNEDADRGNGGARITTVPRREVAVLRLLSRPPVDDVLLRATAGEKVWVRERDGRERDGLLLSYSADSITLVENDDVVVDVPRGGIAELRQRVEKRRFGINLGLLPGLMLDADVGLFRSYVSGSIVFPAALEGKLWGFSTGLGVGVPISKSTPQFKVDVLAHANLMGVASQCSACNYPTAHVFGFGAAVGLHNTFDSGFTLGFTLPVMGYSVTPNYHGTANAYVGHYFLSSVVSMPLAYLGYRI